MSFQTAARESRWQDAQLRRNIGKATTLIREKRLRAVAELPDWEELRDAGEAIKAHTMATLPEQLEQLEAVGDARRRRGALGARRRGGQRDRRLDRQTHGTDEVIKVKSLATDEIEMNEALLAEGIHALETDLAELIVQLDPDDKQSHILVPAIHRNRAEIRAAVRTDDRTRSITRQRGVGASPRPRGCTCATKFLTVPMAVSGANFGIAETGTIGVVESEGNGRMCLTLPRVLVTLMGIEKVLPAWQDLEVFLQLLPRLLDRRADEPVHVAVDGRACRATARRSSTWCCSTAAAPTCWRTRSAARRCTASAARRA